MVDVIFPIMSIEEIPVTVIPRLSVYRTIGGHAGTLTPEADSVPVLVEVLLQDTRNIAVIRSKHSFCEGFGCRGNR
jgi:hypothetical protein